MYFFVLVYINLLVIFCWYLLSCLYRFFLNFCIILLLVLFLLFVFSILIVLYWLLYLFISLINEFCLLVDVGGILKVFNKFLDLFFVVDMVIDILGCEYSYVNIILFNRKKGINGKIIFVGKVILVFWFKLLISLNFVYVILW